MKRFFRQYGRLTLALAAVLEGLTSGIALLNPDVYDQLRFWQAGSLDIRNLHTLKVVLIPVLIAGATALLLSRALNSLNLGSDTATALGSRVARTQLIGLLTITVLCGSATAVVGPIAFIGLMMPHMARWLVGADHRWSLPVTLLATPALLLFVSTPPYVIVAIYFFTDVSSVSSASAVSVVASVSAVFSAAA